MKWIIRLAALFSITQLIASSCKLKDSPDNPTLLRLTNLSANYIMGCAYVCHGFNIPYIKANEYESLRADIVNNTILPGETKVIFDAEVYGGLKKIPKLLVYILDAKIVEKYPFDELGFTRFILEKQYFHFYDLYDAGPYVKFERP